MNTISKQLGYAYENSKPLHENVIQGEKYRFTILTESLIRLEYSEDGNFEDRPTVFAKNRNFNQVQYNLIDEPEKIKIETKYFKLTYKKNRPFKASSLIPDANLKVEVLNSNRVWHYNHPEIRNFGTPGKLLTDADGKINFVKGLFSIDGFSCIDDSKNPIVLENGDTEKRSGKDIDLYLFVYLTDFGTCLIDYYKLTGFPPLIPRYALGNWWSRDVEYNENELNELIKEFYDNEIPISLILLNHDWHIRNYENDNRLLSGFTFNKNYFEDSQRFINMIHSHGIKLGLSIDPTPGIYPFEENYDKYKNFIGSNDIIIPFNAFSGQHFVAYFNFLIKPLLDRGIDALWINDANIDKNVQLMLNIYHSANVLSLNKRILLLTNNALTVPHRYPVLYSGNSIVNWNTLKKIPFHNLSATNIGVSWWSHDIGGFHKGIEDNELYTRFVQLGVFSPIFKFGAAGGKYYKREPWLWEVKTYRIVREYLKLRHKLIPYLYTEMYKNHRYGTPLIKPLYYKVLKMYDDSIYRNEYYFGSEMFVAPIIDKKDLDMNRVIHRFYLPDGMWYEYFSGKKFTGNKKYIYFVKDEDYPVFVKAGGIIPSSLNDGNNTDAPKNMEIQVFPGQNNIYNLYEDDGISYMCNQGFYILTKIEYQYMPNNYILSIKPVSGKTGVISDFRNYKIRFRNTQSPENINVQINNTNVNYNSYEDENDFIVEVDNVSTIGNLLINISGDNINIDSNRIMNDEIVSILNDLQIETEMKERIDNIMFSDLTINKKRIAIRKLQKKKLEGRYVNLFLKLLEYIE